MTHSVHLRVCKKNRTIPVVKSGFTFLTLYKSAFDSCALETLAGAGAGGRVRKKVDPEEVKPDTNVTYVCLALFLFPETFSGTWSLMESDFFASDSSLTLNAGKWFILVSTVLSNPRLHPGW